MSLFEGLILVTSYENGVIEFFTWHNVAVLLVRGIFTLLGLTLVCAGMQLSRKSNNVLEELDDLEDFHKTKLPYSVRWRVYVEYITSATFLFCGLMILFWVTGRFA